MEGSKIKNIIIIILLLLNGFLLVPVGGRRAQNARSQDEARNSAVAILHSNGIGLDADAVPRKVDLPALQVVRDLTLEQEQAAALLGGEMTVQARGGDVYRYESPLGWIQVHSTGEFFAHFQPGAFPVSEDVVKQGTRLLASLGFEAVLREQTEGRLVFEQLVDRVRVLGCEAVLTYEDGEFQGIDAGSRVSGSVQTEPPRSVVSVATALMWLYNGLNELGDLYSRIEQVEPAYRASVSLSESARLTPVWYVKTDTGAYQMDLQNGQVSRIGGFVLPVAQAERTIEES